MALDLDSLEGTTRECVLTVLDAYAETALWASADDEGNPLDECVTKDDFDGETWASMQEDVEAFLSACWGDTWPDFEVDLSGIEPRILGHDFWLTRNRHGAGFWDRGLGDVGDKLTALAQSFGSTDLYIGDDGLVYAF